MRKKYKSLFIILIVVAAVTILVAAWMKITNKQYADDALTIAVTLEISTIVIAVGWFLFTALKKKSLNF